jgi:hypothetical protein
MCDALHFYLGIAMSLQNAADRLSLRCTWALHQGSGPLFYNEPKQLAASADPTNPHKPRYVKARERGRSELTYDWSARPRLRPRVRRFQS